MDPQQFQQLLDSVAVVKTDKEGILRVKKLKKFRSPCPYGGAAANCSIDSRLVQTPQPHWRHKCSHCGAWITPENQSKVFLKTPVEVNQFYRDRINKK